MKRQQTGHHGSDASTNSHHIEIDPKGIQPKINKIKLPSYCNDGLQCRPSSDQPDTVQDSLLAIELALIKIKFARDLILGAKNNGRDSKNTCTSWTDRPRRRTKPPAQSVWSDAQLH